MGGNQRARAKQYHHGNLRQALLVAGEAELAEKGVEGFTLRGCAKRAGVSHAAPAYHFKDAGALLTALAAEGFRRFMAAMRARQAQAPGEPLAQLLALGLGYVDFALANPSLFRLMFSSVHPDPTDQDFHTVSKESFELLVAAIARLHGHDPTSDPTSDPELTTDLTVAWSVVHGLANLLLAGRLPFLSELPPEKREATVREVILRAIPS